MLGRGSGRTFFQNPGRKQGRSGTTKQRRPVGAPEGCWDAEAAEHSSRIRGGNRAGAELQNSEGLLEPRKDVGTRKRPNILPESGEETGPERNYK